MTRDQLKKLENDLWSAADNLRANSDLKASEYGTPVLGLIFLKFADINYRRYEAAIQAEFEALKGTRRERPLAEIAVAKCGFYLPAFARYRYLLTLPEDRDLAKALEDAMDSIEYYKPELRGSLPKDEYYRLTRTPETKRLPFDLLRQFDNIPDDATGDVFGQIYEYFLGKFAMAEGQGGGEFFTPRSVVRLMVEIIEPHGGTVFDPACGSGGMFVQSADFIARHRLELEAQGRDTSVYVYGQEKQGETVKLARMNLAVNGLRGEIKAANTYYADEFQSFGTFDYVLANPPFNVDDVSPLRRREGPPLQHLRHPAQQDQGQEGRPGQGDRPQRQLSLDQPLRHLAQGHRPRRPGHGQLRLRRPPRRGRLPPDPDRAESHLRHVDPALEHVLFGDAAGHPLVLRQGQDRPDASSSSTPATSSPRSTAPTGNSPRSRSRTSPSSAACTRAGAASSSRLIDRYFASGMERLAENRQQVEPVSAQLLAVLEDQAGKAAVAGLVKAWDGLDTLQQAYVAYQQHSGGQAKIEDKNTAQQELRATFEPFFTALHDCLKQLDRAVRHQEKQAADQAKADGKRGGPDRQTKALKTALEAIHAEVRGAESWFSHIHWLQERFPEARYEDVTGLCKLANLDEVKEQDYSLNPGRYVGVVIEEDGKTEEEFVADLAELGDQLAELNKESEGVSITIQKNLASILDLS
jgi:type I restriction enzyme M protein